jgi:hypothetical protein
LTAAPSAANVGPMSTTDPDFGVDLGVLPFNRSYWVLPGKLLAGFYPFSSDPITGRRRIESLLDAGVDHIVDLTEEGEGSHFGTPLADYGEMLAEVAAERDALVTHRRHPVVDLDIPTIETMVGILDAIDDAIARGRTVYVHCWGGRGRTGTAVGCWLARHAMASGAGALAMIRYLRRTDAKADTEAPETEAQKAFVVDWPRGR